jgi:hypothetical protein
MRPDRRGIVRDGVIQVAARLPLFEQRVQGCAGDGTIFIEHSIHEAGLRLAGDGALY